MKKLMATVGSHRRYKIFILETGNMPIVLGFGYRNKCSDVRLTNEFLCFPVE